MVSGGGLAAGAVSAALMRKRLNELTELRRLLGRLRSEISYGCVPLSEAFSAMSERTGTELSGWLKGLGKRLSDTEGGDFFSLWQESLRDLAAETCLKAQDVDLLRELGRSLGCQDAALQIAAIEQVAAEIDFVAGGVRETLPGRQKTAFSLYSLGGVMLAIVLF